MISYSFDNKSLFKGEKRWFPIMGEIHYSRYPDSGWKEALLKMKESNIDKNNVIVHAPYIINLANTEKYEFAVNFLKEEISRCEQLEMSYF